MTATAATPPTPTFSSNATSAGKPTNHIPTNAPCAQCHTTAGNYALYVMGATGHKGITSNCAQCHAYGLSFYNMAPPTLKQPAAGATGHIPAVAPNGTAKLACELCHSAAVFTSFAGTVMKHAVVTSMKCMSCHEYGMKWQTNTGSGCGCGWPEPPCRPGLRRLGLSLLARQDGRAGSHATPTPATAATAGRPSRHRRGGANLRCGRIAVAANRMPSGPACCPAPSARGPFRHACIGARACVTCHTAAGGGKPPATSSTSDSCQSCHTTLAWLPVRSVDHTQVRGELRQLPRWPHRDRQALAPPAHQQRLRELPHQQRLDAGPL